jgi:hypothetical protein
MKSITLLLLYWCLSLPMVSPLQERGWRGIIPLHSTRADVERLIGKPDMQGNLYDYEDERVKIIYQRHTCEENKGEGYNVPIDTVLSIIVNFKNKDRPLSDFPIDWTEYEKMEGGHVEGVAHYFNRAKGISYGTRYGKVHYAEYGGTTADAHLRCPASLKPPALFSFSKLTPAGKKLIDSFVLRVKAELGASGLINLNQEYKKPDEVESMKRSIEEYLRRTHSSIYDRLAIGLSFQKDDIEFLIFLKDQKCPIPFPDK